MTLCGLAESYKHIGSNPSVDVIWSICTNIRKGIVPWKEFVDKLVVATRLEVLTQYYFGVVKGKQSKAPGRPDGNPVQI